MNYSKNIKLISMISIVGVIFSTLLSDVTYAGSRKTYRMKTGEDVRCVGAKDDEKLSRNINFKGKGFHRFIKPIKVLNCTMLKETSAPSNVSSTSPARKINVVLSCPTGLSYATNFLAAEKYRDTFLIGCGVEVYPLG
jgi:capsular polysaccharide biosynthesis protein